MKRVVGTILALLVSMVPLYGAAPLADKLPPGTLVYAGWAGRNLAFDGSMLGQLLTDPAMGRLVATLREAIAKSVPNEESRESIFGAMGLGEIVWQHPLAVGLTDFAVTPEGPRFSAVLLADLGNDRGEFEKRFNKVWAIVAKNASADTVVVSGTTCNRIRLPMRHDLLLGFSGSLFFVAVSEDAVRDLLEPAPGKSLATNPGFAAAMKAVGSDSDQLALYMDVTRLVSLTDPKGISVVKYVPGTPGNELRRISGALGLGKVTAVAGAARVVDRGLYSRLRVFSPAPHQGILMLFAGGALPAGEPAGVPEDALGAHAIRLSPLAAFEEIRRVTRELDPADEGKFLEAVAGLERELGFSVTKDLLPAMGDPITIVSAPSIGGFLTGTAATVTLRDAARVQALLPKVEAWLAQQCHGTIAKADKYGIRYVEMRFTPISPAWAVYKDRLYIALWPQVVQSAIEMGEPANAPLRETVFQQYRKRVSDKASMVSFTHWPLAVRNLYCYALPVSSMLSSQSGGAFHVDQIPALTSIEKYLWPSILAAFSDDEGITFEGYGSLPSSCLVFGPLLTPMSVAPMVTTGGPVRGEAKKAASASNLNAIGRGIAMYMAEHNDQPPPDLETLVTENQIPRKALRSPQATSRPGADAKTATDYLYLVMPDSAEGQLIRAYERPENYGGMGTNVLLVSGGVTWMEKDAFEALLTKTQAWQAAYRPATTTAPAKP